MTIMDFYLSNKENIMHKPVEPIRCQKCGTTVNVNTSMISTSNPPCYEWTCPNCGEKGYTKLGGTTTNADNNTAPSAIPAWSVCSTNTKCTICGEVFGFDGEHRICPKCREAIIKLRGTADSTSNAMPADKSTVTDTKSTACDIPEKPSLQQGWECPKCGAILAPHQHYCPFCSPSEYGRSNWVVTTPVRVPLEQYTNPNPSTAISLGDKPKKSGSCTATFATPSETGVTWKLEQ